MTEAYVINTAAVSDPVTVSELKEHLRIPTTDTSEDAYLVGVISAAVSAGEGYTRRDFSPRTWDLLLDGFDGRVRLRRAPANTVDSFNVLRGGVWVAEPSSNYYLKQTSGYAELVYVPGATVPVGDFREQNMKITFQTGYATVPAGVKQAVLTHAASIYTERGDVTELALYQSASVNSLRLPPEVRGLYSPFVIYSLA